MITNKGREVIGKFLLGQAPEFASYLALGCGAKPIQTGASASYNSNQNSLEFESFRVPVIARGFINEQNLEEIVLKAELPTTQRYLISEMAVYPAQTNSLAGLAESKSISGFVPEERWLYTKNNTQNVVPYVTQDITSNPDTTIKTSIDLDLLSASAPCFFVSSSQPVFNNQIRQQRYESPRFFDKSLIINANSASINNSYQVSSDSAGIENYSIPVNLSRNLPTDEIRLALSLISRDVNDVTVPDTIKVILQFVNNTTGATQPSATANIDLSSAFSQTNRYFIQKNKLSTFSLTSGFSWSNINLIRFYVSMFTAGNQIDTHFLCIDSMRLENLSTSNPIYGMVSYLILETENAVPIIKRENTANYAEYRLGISVIDD